MYEQKTNMKHNKLNAEETLNEDIGNEKEKGET